MFSEMEAFVTYKTVLTIQRINNKGVQQKLANGQIVLNLVERYLNVYFPVTTLLLSRRYQARLP